MTTNGPVSSGDLFFFYGLLKQGAAGMPDHIDLEAAGAFLNDVWVRGALYDLGGFPGVVAGDGLVQGIQYRLDAREIADQLDAFEDVLPDDPKRSLYRRERTALLTANGDPIGKTAWIYIYNQPVDAYGRIDTGVWPLEAGTKRKEDMHHG